MNVIDIVTEGLRKHAGRVDGVAVDIYDARRAAGQVSMQHEAYGRLCSPLLVPVLDGLEAAGIGAMTVSALAVEGTADALRAMAGTLEVVDEIAAGMVREAGR